MTFLKKKDHWADKKFLFFFDTPGKRAAYNGGTVHLHTYQVTTARNPRIFNLPFRAHDPARASVGTLNDARTDGLLVQGRDSPV